MVDRPLSCKSETRPSDQFYIQWPMTWWRPALSADYDHGLLTSASALNNPRSLGSVLRGGPRISGSPPGGAQIDRKAVPLRKWGPAGWAGYILYMALRASKRERLILYYWYTGTAGTGNNTGDARPEPEPAWEPFLEPGI